MVASKVMFLSSLLRRVVPLLLLASTLAASSITYLGGGGALPDATLDQANNVVDGVFQSDLAVAGHPNLPPSGVNLILTLIGFNHPYSGDLVVELIHIPTNTTFTVFSRICKATAPAAYPDPAPGCTADFSPGLANYSFSDDATLNLWTIATPLGDVDNIPQFPYRSSAPLTGALTSFSLFNGINPNGTWRLRITDQFPDTVPDPSQSLLAWSLDLAVPVAPIPEPATLALASAGLTAAALFRRRR